MKIVLVYYTQIIGRKFFRLIFSEMRVGIYELVMLLFTHSLSLYLQFSTLIYQSSFISTIRLSGHQFYTSFSRQFRLSLISNDFIHSSAVFCNNSYTSGFYFSTLEANNYTKNKRVWISPHSLCLLLNFRVLENVISVFTFSC